MADLCFITPCKRSFVPSHTLSDLERTEETSEEKEGERAEDVLSVSFARRGGDPARGGGDPGLPLRELRRGLSSLAPPRMRRTPAEGKEEEEGKDSGE